VAKRKTSPDLREKNKAIMTWWDKTKEKANKTLINAHNAAFGPLTSSKYLTEGVLTPEEVRFHPI
jgi:hypothetical protein